MNNADWFKQVAHQWSLYRPPTRPSKSEIAVWRRYLKPGRRVLILGATPELRDLVAEMNMETVVADINLEMLAAMLELMKQSGAEARETWFKGSWLDAPLAKNYFDCIVGDWILNNLPPSFKKVFFKGMSGLLKSGGLFITRHHFKGVKFSLAGEMERLACQKRPNMSELMFIMTHVSYDKKQGWYRLRDIRADMRNFIKGAKNNRAKYQRIYDQFTAHFPFEKTWYTDGWEELLMKRYFKIKAVEFGDDHRYARLCPIYVLKKR